MYKNEERMNTNLEQNRRKVGKKSGRETEDHKEMNQSKKNRIVEKLQIPKPPSLSLDPLFHPIAPIAPESPSLDPNSPRGIQLDPIAPGSPSLDPNSPRGIQLESKEILKTFALKSYSIPKSKKVIPETDSEESDDDLISGLTEEEEREEVEEDTFNTSLPKEHKTWFDALTNPINHMEPPARKEYMTWKDIEIHAQTNTMVFEMWIAHNEKVLRENSVNVLHRAESMVGTYARLKSLYLQCVEVNKKLNVCREMIARSVEKVKGKMAGNKKGDSL